MKQKTHPKLHAVKLACACGNVVETMSTLPNLTIVICSKCHPFFTGKQKLVDTAGRVERFQKRYAKKA